MCGCVPGTHRYTQSLAPCAEFSGFFIGFSTATTQSPLASQTPAAGGSGRVSGTAGAGRTRGAAPGAGCTHLVPFSHQNEVNFLPKADTAVGKWGEVSEWCSCPGPQTTAFASNCGSTTSPWLLPANPRGARSHLGAEEHPHPHEQPSPSVSLPACSAAPPGRILEKTLSPSAPGCPVAGPVGPRGPVALGPALLSAGGRTKPLLAGDGPGQGGSAKTLGCQAASAGGNGTVPLCPLTCCSQGLCRGRSPRLLWHFRCGFGCVRLLCFRLK